MTFHSVYPDIQCTDSEADCCADGYRSKSKSNSARKHKSNLKRSATECSVYTNGSQRKKRKPNRSHREAYPNHTDEDIRRQLAMERKAKNRKSARESRDRRKKQETYLNERLPKGLALKARLKSESVTQVKLETGHAIAPGDDDELLQMKLILDELVDNRAVEYDHFAELDETRDRVSDALLFEVLNDCLTAHHDTADTILHLETDTDATHLEVIAELQDGVPMHTNEHVVKHNSAASSPLVHALPPVIAPPPMCMSYAPFFEATPSTISSNSTISSHGTLKCEPPIYSSDSPIYTPACMHTPEHAGIDHMLLQHSPLAHSSLSAQQDMEETKQILLGSSGQDDADDKHIVNTLVQHVQSCVSENALEQLKLAVIRFMQHKLYNMSVESELHMVHTFLPQLVHNMQSHPLLPQPHQMADSTMCHDQALRQIAIEMLQSMKQQVIQYRIKSTCDITQTTSNVSSLDWMKPLDLNLGDLGAYMMQNQACSMNYSMTHAPQQCMPLGHNMAHNKCFDVLMETNRIDQQQTQLEAQLIDTRNQAVL